jgi:deoxyribodipyrimidine photo-lyase
VSKLSPYITRGVISLPVIRDIVYESYSAKDAEKFIQELAWREYFQKVYSAKGEEIFSDLRFSREDWQHGDVVKAIAEGQTGIKAIDNAIIELEHTGYMHNHARMWTAMLACNVAKAGWYNMSRWLYYHLLDGDLASNTLSWQWVAGTSIQKQYVANQELINACSDSDQIGTYLDVLRETVGEREIPPELVAAVPFAYQTTYPTGDEITSLKDKTVYLYHPWSIDPLWHQKADGVRIFVIELRLFDRFPVSPKVLEHMIELVRTHIPGVLVYVGNVETLPDINKATIYSKSHQTSIHFPGIKENSAELFPQVQGYYPSFFKFWQACTTSGE